ncbi:solute carrier family 22 member 14 [Hipposideros larvatus]
MFADIFVFAAQTPHCNTSWILALGPNLSEAEQLNLTLPQGPNGSFQTCLMYTPVAWDLDSIIQFGLNATQSCQDGWVYPESKSRSLINEFDLVCGKELNMETVQTLFLVGLLIGSLIFGFISDKLGRYPSIVLSLLALIIFGFGTAFVSSFHQYLFFRFGVSQALVGYSISSVSLVTEWLVGEHGAHAIILAHCFFSAGIMFLSGLAYSLSHWRLLFLVGGAPVFSIIFYIWILPESPRWLMMKGKVEKAKQVLCYAAYINKKTIPFSLLDKLSGKRETNASVLDFYNNRQLRKVTLMMGCVWFTVGYSYFMLNIKMKDFGMNIHSRLVIHGIMEVPARLWCIFLLEQMGRKWSLGVTLFQGFFMSLLILIFPPEFTSMTVLMVLVGECSLAASVTVFFIYTAELLPTVLRATGLGLVSLAWVAGAILSLTLINQSLTVLSSVLSCLSAILALSVCSQLPETHNQPLSDSLDNYPLRKRSLSKDSTTGDAFCDDTNEEVVKNTFLNAMNLDPDLLSNTPLQYREATADKTG